MKFVILGAGPSGLGSAFQLRRRNLGEVTVLEQRDRVGGNAGSFDLAGLRVDYGSHRLHAACDPEILRDIRDLLGEELVERPRHGRIYLGDRWIHFPLKPVDLCLKVRPGFAWGVGADAVRKTLGRSQTNCRPESFASVLELGLGRTICRNFYFPYCQKLWGLPPEELSALQAKRRVSADSLGKIARRIFSGLLRADEGRAKRFFYYPRKGYGQISGRLYDTACQLGAHVMLSTRVQSVKLAGNSVQSVRYEHDRRTEEIHPDYVWSTIPITVLVQCLEPPAPPAVLEAVNQLDYRAMVLVYLVVEQHRFSEYDAHYFPGPEAPITRLSEPKNYSGAQEPLGRTVLCAELPCAPTDPVWQMEDAALGELVQEALASVGIPIGAPVRQVVTQRIRQAYPVYRRGFEQHFDVIDQWLDGIQGLLTFGRQGLFAHDNTHHALSMAYAAVRCLNRDGQFNRARWREARRVFERHVVED